MTRNKVEAIIEKLLNHDIDKRKAVDDLLYLFQTSNKGGTIKDALNESVKAIYFNDSSDYLDYHWKVVGHLSGVGNLSRSHIEKMYHSLNPEQ